MSTVATQVYKKNVGSPDEIRSLEKTKIEVVRLGDRTLMRLTFQPGWKWSRDIGEAVGSSTCEDRHFGYVLSGQCKVVLSDGTEFDLGPGDVMDLPPGHDGWVVGSEPFVAIDFLAGETYGKTNAYSDASDEE